MRLSVRGVVSGQVPVGRGPLRLRETSSGRRRPPPRLARYPGIGPRLRCAILPAPPAPPGPGSRRRRSERRARARDWIDSWRWTGAARVTGDSSSAPASKRRCFRASSPGLTGNTALGKGNRLAGDNRKCAHGDTAVRHAGVPRQRDLEVGVGGAFLRGTLDGLAFLAPAGGARVLRRAGRERFSARRPAGRARKRAARPRSGARRRGWGADGAGRNPRKRLRAPDRLSGRERRIRRHARRAARTSAARRRRRAVERHARGPDKPRVRRRLSRRAPLGAAGRRPASRRPVPSGPPSQSRASTSGTSRRRAACARRKRFSRVSPVHAEAGTFSIDAGLAQGPRPPLGSPPRPRGRPLPSGSSSERAVPLATSWHRRLVHGARAAGGLRTDQPRGIRRAPCAHEIGRGRSESEDAERRMGAARRSPRGLSSEVQLRTSVF